MNLLEHTHRIIIKIGSNLLADATTGTLRTEWLASLAEDIAALHVQGKKLVIVSSGAVALGKRKMYPSSTALTLEQKQAVAACGQIVLMQGWSNAFTPHSLEVAQLLLTAGDTEHRRRYLNARTTLETLLEADVIPIINENDTVSTDEIRVGDNDRLAARVAQMAGAELLILLSDIDGLYDADPTHNPEAKHMAEVNNITPEVEAMAGKTSSESSSGGMVTKIAAAKIATQSGCHMVISKGSDLHPLKQLEENTRHTHFMAQGTPQSARKHWISGHLKPLGSVTIDDGAATALQAGKSLLTAGVISVEGNFNRGDAIVIKSASGTTLGTGLSSYDAEDACKVIGRNSAEIENILGIKRRSALIHRNEMALLKQL